MSANITHHTLEAFLDAFNRHDLDAIMDYFAEECVTFTLERRQARRPAGRTSIGRRPGDPITSTIAIWAHRLVTVRLRRQGAWSRLSDHVPLTVELDLDRIPRPPDNR